MSIDEDGLLGDAEGAKILGMNNPLESGDPRETQIAALSEHLIQEVVLGAIAFAEGAKMIDTVQGLERSELLLGAQDTLIHLMIDVHSLLHLTPRHSHGEH